MNYGQKESSIKSKRKRNFSRLNVNYCFKLPYSKTRHGEYQKKKIIKKRNLANKERTK